MECIYKKYKKYVSEDCNGVFTPTEETLYSENIGTSDGKEYRWAELADNSEYICVDNTKYRKCYLEVNEGSGWTIHVPVIHKLGMKIEDKSTDCGYGRIRYMWRLDENDTSTIELGVNDFRYEYLYSSTDEGETWTKVPEGTKRIGPINTHYARIDKISTDTVAGHLDLGMTKRELTFRPHNEYNDTEISYKAFRSIYSIDDVATDKIRGLELNNNVISYSMTNPFGESAYMDYVTLGENIEYFYDQSKSHYSSLDVPSSVVYLSLRGNKDFKTLTLREGLKYIDGMIYNTKLTEINLPSSLVTVSERIFSDNELLTNVNFNEGLRKVEYNMFYNCPSLGSISIPRTVDIIGIGAFTYCSGLTSVTLPEGLRSIGGDAFNSCEKLKNITIPSTVTEIGGGAFAYCSGLTSVTLPDKLQSLGGTSFRGTKITELNIPDSTWYVGGNVLWNTSIKSFSITLGKGVRLFGGLTNTSRDQDITVTFKSKVPPKFEYYFDAGKDKLTIRVPSQSVELYKKVLENVTYYQSSDEKYYVNDCIVGY